MKYNAILNPLLLLSYSLVEGCVAIGTDSEEWEQKSPCKIDHKDNFNGDDDGENECNDDDGA